MNIGVISNDRNMFSLIEDNVRKVFDQYIFQKYRSFTDFNYYRKSFELDCLFVDIDLESWLEGTKRIKKQFQNMKIIFFGSQLEESYKTYEIDHVSFIYKNDLSYIQNTLHSLNIFNDENQYCTFNWKDRHFIKNIKDILYFERDLRKTLIYMNSGDVFETYKHLDEFKKECADYKRIHVKYLVNPIYIKEYTCTHVILQNDIQLPISRRYQDEKLI
ncbi:MAG: LytR/AlgR family response regulator transcription factor [Floccifex sp.]